MSLFQGSWFQFPGLEFRGSGRCRVSCFPFLVLGGFGSMAQALGSRCSFFIFRVRGFGFRAGFEFQVVGFGFQRISGRRVLGQVQDHVVLAHHTADYNPLIKSQPALQNLL